MNVTIKKLNDMGLVVETLSDSSYMVSSEAFKNCYKLKRIVIPKKNRNNSRQLFCLLLIIRRNNI